MIYENIRKRVLSLTLAITLLLLLVPGASEEARAAGASLDHFTAKNTYSGQFQDVPSSVKYYNSVRMAYEYGLMTGTTDTTFAPNGNITIGQALIMACRVRDIYNGGTGTFTQSSPWYQTYEDYAIANGVMKPGDFANYSARATRAEMAYLFAHALPETALGEINVVYMLPDVKETDEYGEEIFQLYRAGVLTGSDTSGTFTPKSSITRAQAAIILTRLAIVGERKTLHFSNPIGTDDLEILRAVADGFVPKTLQGNWSKTVTYKEFCTLLGNMMALYEPSLSGKWSALTKKLPSQTITRQEAMMACYLAGQAMGLTEVKHFNEETAVDQDTMFRKSVKWSSALNPEWNKTAYTSTDSNGAWDNAIMAAIFYGMRQTSRIGSVPLFTADGDDLRVGDALTREEAIHAVLRLFEADPDSAGAKANERIFLEQLKGVSALSGILSGADSRRNGILNSETKIQKGSTYVPGETYSGTAYYVSNTGSDNANGLTPKTAWATLDRVNRAVLHSGDAVLFERGGVWRGQVKTQDGITYSTYGEGEKPKLYGSPENGSGAEKWKLYANSADGGKIWVYYQNMPDCSALVFDGGKAWTNRRVPFWNGKNFIAGAADTAPIDVTTWLNKDLTTFSAADSNLPSSLPAYSGWEDAGTTYDMQKNVGPLYVRCDKGNPGTTMRSSFLFPATPLWIRKGTARLTIYASCTADTAVFPATGTVAYLCRTARSAGVADVLRAMYTKPPRIMTKGTPSISRVSVKTVGGRILVRGNVSTRIIIFTIPMKRVSIWKRESMWSLRPSAMQSFPGIS